MNADNGDRSYPSWGPSRSRSLHYDPVLHVLVEGDVKLCTGTPGKPMYGETNRAPHHACRRCVRIWKQQTTDGTAGAP